MVKNSLSVDLESFIYRELDPHKRKKDDGYTPRATSQILNLLDTHNTKITFFILGEIYEQYPELVDEIRKRGHEIGYHGHTHQQIMSKEILLEELERSAVFIKKFKPIGFRAPRMYLPMECLEVLSSYGFTYDSSIYGGIPFKTGGMVEVPVSAWSPWSISAKFPRSLMSLVLSMGIPYGSGLSFALFGKLISRFVERENKEGNSSILFVHPWQFMPYTLVTGKNRFLSMLIYRTNINNTFEYLLKRHMFVPMRELVKA